MVHLFSLVVKEYERTTNLKIKALALVRQESLKYYAQDKQLFIQKRQDDYATIIKILYAQEKQLFIQSDRCRLRTYTKII